MTTNIYEKLSEERKQLQEEGKLPVWFTTAGWQLFKEKYLYQASSYKEQIERIAWTASNHLPRQKRSLAYEWFFNLLWNGWLSPSTPVLANMGTDRGLPVSCAGNYVQDSINGFYSARKENALLTKHGFGTSSYLGDIRGRGAAISNGGHASGIVPVLKGFVQDMEDVSQGNTRRGAWAGYIPITHTDFDECCEHLQNKPDGANIGWIISNEFIQQLENGNPECIRRYQKAMKTKMVTGKGYFFFHDKVQAKRPEIYKERGNTVFASNLCSEIMLAADESNTFTCVLSSMNVSKYDEWKNTEAVYWATIFLDCVAQEFIVKSASIEGLEKARAFTMRDRALGLGQCGLHTLFQQKGIAFESLEAHLLSTQIAKSIKLEAERAADYLEELWGVRNTHLIAIAPTKSTSLLMGGISEGINPDPAMVYQQKMAGGEVTRVNPILLEIMKERSKYTTKILNDIIDHGGSVQHVSWLSDEEKLVFKTAFEIDQSVILRMASVRGTFIDQWQSLNLFFSSDENEEYISKIHKQAFLDPNILALYYIYSKSGVQASKDECIACQ
jgi:ribonucleoside-diphosphate reductase alpha chain